MSKLNAPPPVTCSTEAPLSRAASPCDMPGVFATLGALPPSSPVTEEGLANLLQKNCVESIKRAVARGELPRPVRMMGKPTWTVGFIIRHLETRLESEAKEAQQLRKKCENLRP